MKTCAAALRKTAPLRAPAPSQYIPCLFSWLCLAETLGLLENVMYLYIPPTTESSRARAPVGRARTLSLPPSPFLHLFPSVSPADLEPPVTDSGGACRLEVLSVLWLNSPVILSFAAK